MHELGLVFYVIDDAKEAATAHGATRVGSVTLQLGEVSGVVTELFEDAWRWAADRDDMLRGAELVIEQIPAITLCEDCGALFGTVEHGRICPECHSPRTHLTQGNELLIKEIEAE